MAVQMCKISDPSERYINQPEKGPSFHSDVFMQKYNEGFNSCSRNSKSSDIGGDTNNISRNKGDESGNTTSGSNWEQLCLNYGDVINIDPGDCSNYAHGHQLTSDGKIFLDKKLINAAKTTNDNQSRSIYYFR